MGVEEKLRGFLSKSAEVSKNVLSKAGDAVQEFSDKSVIKIDKMKLENQKNKKIAELGQIVYEILQNPDANVSLKDETVNALMTEISNIDKDITEKNDLLNKSEDDGEVKETE